MTAIMVQGTSSGAGKTLLVAGLCRALADRGHLVAPFKSQNMSRYAHAIGRKRISRAQAVQAHAARCEITPDINPILLNPKGDNSSDVYVNGVFHAKMSAKQYYQFAKKQGLRIAKEALSKLESAYDIVVIEGAGSPAEINIGSGDIANMAMADAAKAPVILVADIERGGVFASIVGTFALLEPKHKRRIKGIVINKFRGDERVLESGYERLEKITSKPVLGTIPMIKHSLPEEDSIGKANSAMPSSRVLESQIKKITSVLEERLDIEAIIGMCRK